MNSDNTAKAQSLNTFTRIKIYDRKCHISFEAGNSQKNKKIN